MSVTPPEITNGGSNPPEVIQTEDFTELLFTGSKSTGFEATVTSDTAIAASKPVKEADITINSSEGETVVLGIQATKVAKSEIKNEGNGSLDMKVRTGSFLKNTVTGGKNSDSVSFGTQTKLKKVDADLGEGDDSVTFGKNTEFKGKSTFDLGEGGADAVKFKSKTGPDSGKIVFKNVDENDTFQFKKKTFTGAEVAAKEKFDNIKIEFAD